MRITVDRKACEANGVCAGIAPELFDLDDEDVLHVVRPEPPPELHDRARRAVDACPKRALYLDPPP